ncbi:MAG: DNA-processing protein DprA [Chloroflexi bacterium CFX4]|nr:DNA-processing protein DprA [Chloroflexi bacterium CFX4]MDL1923645.1 DNA-processing protein DprA [Chloroflexi bacterium CFX3]
MIAERTAAAALALTEGIGWQTLNRLLSAFGTPAAVLAATPQQVARLRGVSAQVRANLSALDQGRLAENLARWRAEGVCFALWYEADYPPAFTRLADRPLICFWRGAALPNSAHSIALVGTRQPSAESVRLAAEWAAFFAGQGWAVISGLARGIDSATHKAVLAKAGYTAAVLGGGILRVYPPENAAVADQLCRVGALLSEYAPDLPVRPDWLVLRNRLISALCRAVIVVEAPARSGALHAARYAHLQGSPVFALPNSEGSRALLNEFALPLPETPQHLLTWLRTLPFPPESPTSVSQPLPLFGE